MGRKAGLIGFGDSVRVVTFFEACKRCGKSALKKAAGRMDDVNEKGEPVYPVMVLCCPHCGLWVHTGFVEKRNKSAIEHLKRFGYFELPCRNNPKTIAMNLVIEATGALVMGRKNGTFEFVRIGNRSKELTFADAEGALTMIDNTETLDRDKSYLARWNRKNEKLEVLSGVVPTIDISRRTDLVKAWEDSLIRPGVTDRDPKAFEPLIGILMNDSRNLAK